MAEGFDVKDGFNAEEVLALIETLRGMVDLEEGELYTLRKGMFRHVRAQDEENGLRRIKIMEEAYAGVQHMARRLRRKMRGYRPDPALVASAFVMHAVEHLAPDDADDIAMKYLQRLFSRTESSPIHEASASADAPVSV